MTACRLTFSQAVLACSSVSIPSVRSTFTRRIGLTTVNFPVKNEETSSPRDALPAISSAPILGLDLFGIRFHFLFGCLPVCYQMMVFPNRIAPHFEDDRTDSTLASADGANCSGSLFSASAMWA
jgi:hypothetical protein